MNILILNGSPNHDKGTTGTIIKTLEKGLRKTKPKITTKYVYKLNVKPCQGCFSCWSNTPGKCIQLDDVEELLHLVAESDILILATPVYVDGMTGPLKTLLDRFIPLIKGRVELREDHMRHIVRDEVKRGKIALVSSSGFAEMDNFVPLVTHVKALSKNLGRDYIGEVLVPSAWYYKYDEDVLGRALELIESAGEELGRGSDISCEVSTEIGSLVSRE
jgi:multimeric flavodoxin WrbA